MSMGRWCWSMSTWRTLSRAQDLGPVRAVLRAHLYEDQKAEAKASLGLNEVQKRETLELMDATLAGDAREDCGDDGEARG